MVMKIYDLTKREFDKLGKLELSRHVFNTEGIMYLVDSKKKWAKDKAVIKEFYNNEGEYFSNKLYTINELIMNKDNIDIEELVLPNSLISVDNEIIGYSMPYVDSYNLQDVLKSSEFTSTEKISYLKQVGEILEKMRLLREYGVKDFYLNDIHESNFVVNKDTNKIHVVDLDSCKIKNNLTFSSKYLSPVGHLSDIGKYKELTKSLGGVFKINYDTELYCYIVMIFNYLLGYKLSELSIPEFYSYLEYLYKLGISREFLDMVSNIYINKPNQNPYEYLDEFNEVIDKTNIRAFKIFTA